MRETRKPDGDQRRGRMCERAPDSAGVVEPLWDVVEVAGFLRVHPKTIPRLMRTHRLPCVRVGSRLRFVPSDVLRWVSARKE